MKRKKGFFSQKNMKRILTVCHVALNESKGISHLSSSPVKHTRSSKQWEKSRGWKNKIKWVSSSLLVITHNVRAKKLGVMLLKVVQHPPRPSPPSTLGLFPPPLFFWIHHEAPYSALCSTCPIRREIITSAPVIKCVTLSKSLSLTHLW